MAKASTVEAPVETATDTLEIQDSRTDRTFNVPITDGAIRASDLKQIKTSDEDDPGLLSYDPAFLNTAACRSRYATSRNVACSASCSIGYPR